jgi:hypothetical protein
LLAVGALVFLKHPTRLVGVALVVIAPLLVANYPAVAHQQNQPCQ